MSYLSTLLVGVILIRFFRTPSERTVELMRDKPWASLGYGLILLLLSVPTLFLLAVTGIGLSLAFILGMVFVIELYLAKIIISLLLGQIAASLLGITIEETGKGKFNVYLILAIGLIIYHLLMLISVLNFFIFTGTIVFGLGAMFLLKKEVLAPHQ